MRLGIVDHQLFVRKHFPNEKLLFLPSFAVGPNVTDSVEAAVEEAIATGSMVDVMVSVTVEYILHVVCWMYYIFSILRYGMTAQGLYLQLACE
jgi:hypothetical protein